jgi:PAS domain S-box-containing protein
MGYKKLSNLKLVLFFTGLTFFMTAIVIYAWELLLRPPFFSWLESRYPGEDNALTRLNIQQRVEHAFISITVDVVVVTLLLRVVRSQQHQLAENEQRYRALFEHSGYGIGIITANDHRLLEANSKFCRILGYHQEELLGSDILKILRVPVDLAGTHDNSDLLSLPPSSERELTIGTAKGDRLPVCISFNTLITDTEHLIILVVRDISARKKLEAEKEVMQQQLFQTSKLASIGELSAGIAHEINNPLNGVINFAQLLKDDEIALTDFQQQLLDGIREEGHRIEQIVRSLLTFARRGTNQFQPVHIAEVINTAIALFRRQLRNDNIRIEIELDPNLPAIYADSSRLRQVVVNMISTRL